MCDTQVLRTEAGSFFAKNSDREASEAQPVIRVDAIQGDSAQTLKTTYLEIEQVPDRHAVILSKPHWIWGAEMGVNDAGVAIGNEAVFTKTASRQPALLGMDLVRLGLERAATADAALRVITGLLERYGQGGPAGYRDKRFCYDNSFIIADAQSAWVLETADRHWVAKRVDQFAAISNQLTIRKDYELCSDSVTRRAGRQGKLDFAGYFDSWLMPFFGRSQQRRSLSMQCLAATQAQPELTRFAAHLRQHASGQEAPLSGSNADLCLHACGSIRRSQTTGSLLAELRADGPRIAVTGTSAPCLSIFRPVDFSGSWSVLTPLSQEQASPLWWRNERLHRHALFDGLMRDEIRRTREDPEAQVFKALARGEADALQDADAAVFQWHERRLQDARQAAPVKGNRYWRTLNRLDDLR